MTQLGTFEHDTLKEIANIGAGNASTALSQMLDKLVDIEVPEMQMVPFDRVPMAMGNVDQIVTIIFQEIVGDAPGTIMILLNPKDATNLAALATHRKDKHFDILDEVDRHALRNIGNIISGASLNALSKFLDLNLLQSVPDAATDMLGAIVNTIVAEFSETSEDVLMLDVEFSVEDLEIEGRIFFVFNPKSTQTLLEATRTHLFPAK